MFQPFVIDASGARDSALEVLHAEQRAIVAAQHLTPEGFAAIRAARERYLADLALFVAAASASGKSGFVPELAPGAPAAVHLPRFSELPEPLLEELHQIVGFMTARAAALSGDHSIGITIRVAPNPHLKSGRDDVDSGFTISLSYSEYP